MDFKNFFHPTKEKIALTLVLFVLANILFFPLYNSPINLSESSDCNPPTTEFIPIWDLFRSDTAYVGYHNCMDNPDLQFEIVYLGFSYLATCIVFYMKSKKLREKK